MKTIFIQPHKKGMIYNLTQISFWALILVLVSTKMFGQTQLTTVGMPTAQVGMNTTVDDYGTISYYATSTIPDDEYYTIQWLDYMTQFIAVNGQAPFELIEGGDPHLSLYDNVPAPPIGNSYFLPNLVEDWTYDVASTNVWHSLIEYEEDANTHIVGGIGYQLLDPSPMFGFPYTEQRPAYQFTNVGNEGVELSMIRYESISQNSRSFYSNHDGGWAGGLYDYDGIDKTSDDYIAVVSNDPNALGPYITTAGVDLMHARLQYPNGSGLGNLLTNLRAAGPGYELTDGFGIVIDATPEIAFQPWTTYLYPGESVLYWLFPRELYFMNTDENHPTNLAYNQVEVDGVGSYDFPDANVTINYDNLVFETNDNGEDATATTTTVLEVTGGLIESVLPVGVTSISSARYWEIFNDTRKHSSQEDITFELDETIDEIVGVSSDNLYLLYRSAHYMPWTIWPTVNYDAGNNTLTAVDFNDDDAQWVIGVNNINTPPSAFNLLLPEANDTLDYPNPTFVWEASDDLEGDVSYSFIWVDSSITDPEIIDVGSDTTFTFADPLEDGVYLWGAIAIDSNSDSTFASNNGRVLFINTQGDPIDPPSKFVVISPVNNEIVQVPNPTFIWESAKVGTNDIFYDLFLYENNIAIDTLYAETDTVFTLPYALTNYTTYEWQVKAYNEINETTGSNIESFTMEFDETGFDTLTVIVAEEVGIPNGIDTVWLDVDLDNPGGMPFSSVELDFAGHIGLAEFIGIDTTETLFGYAGWSIEYSELDGFIYTASAGTEELYTSGTLFRLGFVVLPEASGLYIPIDVVHVLFDDGGSEAVAVGGGILPFNPLYGDIDLNGLVQAYDASFALKYDVGMIDLSAPQKLNGDVTLDGYVTALDASLILQYRVHIIDTLPYVEPLNAIGDMSLVDVPFNGNEIINVPIEIENGQNIFAFKGNVNFDPSILKYEGVELSEETSGYAPLFVEKDGKIVFAGASTRSDLHTGLVANLQFSILDNPEAFETTTVELSKVRLNEGSVSEGIIYSTVALVTGLNDDLNSLPKEYSLNQNYPNPFNPSTIISYAIPEASNVKLQVYNVVGEMVASIINNTQEAGNYSVSWDASQLTSGIYFARITAQSNESNKNFVEVRKMLLMK